MCCLSHKLSENISLFCSLFAYTDSVHFLKIKVDKANGICGKKTKNNQTTKQTNKKSKKKKNNNNK